MSGFRKPHLFDVYHTEAGRFEAYLCDEPKAQPVIATAFFFVYTCLTAFVVLSLFISIITAAMFEIMDKKRRERELARSMEEATPEEKRARLLAELERPDTEINRLVESFFAHHARDDAAAEAREANRSPRVHAQRACAYVAESAVFKNGIIATILLVGVIAVCEQDLADADTRWGGLIPLLNQAVLGVFTLEAAVKITAQGWAGYFDDAWNRFDLAIVLLSYGLLGLNTSGGGVRTLRLLRLLRIIKLLHSFPGLRSVSASLLLALKNVGFVMLMMLLVNFVFAVIGALLFGRNDKMHFSHVANAMATVWMIETLDSWEEVLYTNMYGCDQYGYYDLHGYATSARGCTDPQALGWAAAALALIIVIFGGMVLPTVLTRHPDRARRVDARDQRGGRSQATIGRVLKVAHMVGVVEAEDARDAEGAAAAYRGAATARSADEKQFVPTVSRAAAPHLRPAQLRPQPRRARAGARRERAAAVPLGRVRPVPHAPARGEAPADVRRDRLLGRRRRRLPRVPVVHALPAPRAELAAPARRAAAVGALRRAARSARALSPRASAREHRRAAGAPRAERDLDPRRAA